MLAYCWHRRDSGIIEGDAGGREPPAFSVKAPTRWGVELMRWGPGPVFIYECLANSRRWQIYALRSFGVAALLVAMSLIATEHTRSTLNPWRDYASLGESYFVAMIGVELALVMLAAPAATAGTICVDRAGARWHTCS